MDDEIKKVVDVTDGLSNNMPSKTMKPLDHLLPSNHHVIEKVNVTNEVVDQMIDTMQRNEDEQADTSENDH